MRISRKTLRIVKQNIWFALLVKFAVLLLGACGMASMWAGVVDAVPHKGQLAVLGFGGQELFYPIHLVCREQLCMVLPA